MNEGSYMWSAWWIGEREGGKYRNDKKEKQSNKMNLEVLEGIARTPNGIKDKNKKKAAVKHKMSPRK